MTAHSGDPSAQGPVFPPFGPAVARPAAPAAPGTPAAPPAGGAIPPFMPFASPAAPVAATPTPAPATPAAPADAEPLPWDAPVPSDTAAEESAAVAPGGDADDGSQDGGEADLPWLELPTGAPISRHEEPLPADLADRAAIDASSTAEEAPWEMPSGPTAADEETSATSAPEAAPWETTPAEDTFAAATSGPEAAPWETPDVGARGTTSSDTRWEALADAGSAADAHAAEPWASDDDATAEAAPSSSAEPAAGEAAAPQGTTPDWMSWGGEDPQDPVTIEPVEGLVGIGDLSPADLPPSAETAAEAPAGTETPEPVSSDVTGVVPVGDMAVPPVPPRFTMDDGHEADDRPAPSEAAEPFTPSATGTGAAAQGLTAAMDDVADRLEGIVRALRSGDASAFLASGSADPLHLLVTGFVLGYAERDKAGNG